MKQIILNKLDYLRIQKHIRGSPKTRKPLKQPKPKKLINELQSATLVEPQEIPSDVVTMNSVVKISFADEGKQQEFRIVYPDEADFRAKKVSIFSTGCHCSDRFQGWRSD